MTKVDIVAAVAEKHGLTKKLAREVVDTVFDTVITGIENKEKVSIPNLGTFKPIVRKARTGVNPQTKEKIQIAEKNTVKFKVSSTVAL